jgi:hypothetical protein
VSRWADVEAQAGEFAAEVRKLLDGRRHKTLATLRADGSPRVTGIETVFWNGDLIVGSMPGSRKADDLRRDARLALHCVAPDPGGDDPSAWPGDIAICGSAVPLTDPAQIRMLVDAASGVDVDTATETPPSDFFCIDISRVTWVRIGYPPDHLRIDTWDAAGGLRHIERR